jgi:hypothetical protein
MILGTISKFGFILGILALYFQNKRPKGAENGHFLVYFSRFLYDFYHFQDIQGSK